jgi:hypothetical protein
MKNLCLMMWVAGGFLALLTLVEFLYLLLIRNEQRFTMHQITIWILSLTQTSFLCWILIRWGMKYKVLSLPEENIRNLTLALESDKNLIKFSFIIYQILTLIHYVLLVFYKNVFNNLSSYEDFLEVLLFWIAFTQYAYFGILFQYTIIMPRLEDESQTRCKALTLHILGWFWLLFAGITLFLFIVIISRDNNVETPTKIRFNSIIFFIKTSLVINLFKKRNSTKFAHLLFLFLNLLTVGQTFAGIGKEDPDTEFYEVFMIASHFLIIIYLCLLWKTIREIIPLIRTCYTEIVRNGAQRQRNSWFRRAPVELVALNMVALQLPQGITPEIREKLKNMVKPLEIPKDEENLADFNCVICSQDMVKGEKIIPFPCSHIYHETCIWPWLDISTTCPTCRKDLNGVL